MEPRAEGRRKEKEGRDFAHAGRLSLDRVGVRRSPVALARGVVHTSLPDITDFLRWISVRAAAVVVAGAIRSSAAQGRGRAGPGRGGARVGAGRGAGRVGGAGPGVAGRRAPGRGRRGQGRGARKQIRRRATLSDEEAVLVGQRTTGSPRGSSGSGTGLQTKSPCTEG